MTAFHQTNKRQEYASPVDGYDSQKPWHYIVKRVHQVLPTGDKQWIDKNIKNLVQASPGMGPQGARELIVKLYIFLKEHPELWELLDED